MKQFKMGTMVEKDRFEEVVSSTIEDRMLVREVEIDAELNLKWPKKNITVSKKDKKLPTFNFFCKSFGGL